MKRTDIHKAADLALTYLDDGAFFSAARVLRDMADELDKIGKARSEYLKEQMDNYNGRNAISS